MRHLLSRPLNAVLTPGILRCAQRSISNSGYPGAVRGVPGATAVDHPTRAISWAPVVGPLVPDQTRQMRIRGKAALIDLFPGLWRMVPPVPIEDSSICSGFTRVKSDQRRACMLENKAYDILASELARYCSQ